MTKKDLYCDEVDRLYIQENLNLDEIAAKLNVSIRTLRYWKAGSNWDEKRKDYSKSKQSFQEELYGFLEELIHSIKKNIQNGEKIEPAKINAFIRIFPLISGLKGVNSKIKCQNKMHLREILATFVLLHLLEEDVVLLKN